MSEMEPESLLFVHDARSRACDGVIARLSDLLEPSTSNLQVLVSAQDAAESLRAAARGEGEVRLAFVCLDLQPAPLAGTRIAEFALARGIPVVLVTRSTRWLPPGSALNTAPWVSPDASSEELVEAMRAALDADGRTSGEATYDGEHDPSLDRVSIGF